MWAFQSEELPDCNGRRFFVHGSDAPTFSDVVRAWQTDTLFRASFNAILADVPFSAFRWETPGVTVTTASRPFEFVLLDAPGLARRPDSEAFAEHFSPSKDAIDFANLNGDAILVVPCPIAGPTAYGHLAAFVRTAPESQRDALWRLVGEVMARRIDRRPVWLSTAGAGVSWLHVRFDDRPKYYGHEPYRQTPTAS